MKANTKVDGNSVTVKGSTFTAANAGSNLAGFAYCNKDLENAYGYAKDSLVLDPTDSIKINTTTHPTILSDCGVTQSGPDADGYCTITKATATSAPQEGSEANPDDALNGENSVDTYRTTPRVEFPDCTQAPA